MFPGDSAAADKESATQWLLPSMTHLMTLTLMGLAGYATPAVSPRASHSSASHTTPVKLARPSPAAATASHSSDELMSFVMPPPYVFSPLGKPLPSSSAPNEVRAVRRVVVGRVEELELLWLETCKVYCELANSADAAVAHRAVYCLRVSACGCLLHAALMLHRPCYKRDARCTLRI